MIVTVRTPEGPTRLPACTENCAAGIVLTLTHTIVDGHPTAGHVTPAGDCVHCAWCGLLIDLPVRSCFTHGDDPCPEQVTVGTVASATIMDALLKDNRVLNDPGVAWLEEQLQKMWNDTGYLDPAPLLARMLRR